MCKEIKDPNIFVDKLIFNDGTELEIGHSDIVIFTGANNAGKSQVLKDIDNLMDKSVANGVVLLSIETDYTGSILSIVEEFRMNNGYYYVLNNGYPRAGIIDDMWKNKDARFANYFKTILNTEQRLQASNTSASFNALTQDPTTPVQKLYVEDTLEDTISKLFHEAFNEYLIVNRAGGNQIPVHVGQPPVKEEGEDRVSRGYLEKLKLLPVLQSQGDGMRSFAGILFEIFTTQKSVAMIDEPEAFLHPPQARLLGRMLVKNKPNERQLFISTHSEDFLKGLLDAESDNVKIVRINRVDNVNHIKVLNNDGVKSLWKDSILRYSNILSGLFHSKVVICESDTDCRFYNAILDALFDRTDVVSPDILFTHCGGKERLKAVVPSLRALNVKIVVVTDMDILDNEDTFKTLCEKMDIDWDLVKNNWKTVFEYVKGQRAQLNTDEARKAIEGIFGTITTPQLSNDDIDAIKDKLKASSAWSKVKEVGKNFFTGGAYTALCELMNQCREKGLFIVPVGELECFYKPASKKHGSAWVNTVMTLDLANEQELEAARRFVKEIVEY